MNKNECEVSSVSTSGVVPGGADLSINAITEYIEQPCAGHNCLYKVRRHSKWYILKGLKPVFRSQRLYVEMLRKEFDLAASLDHPNIVGTYTLEDNERVGLCVLMEYVDGVTLRDFLATNPSEQLRYRIMTQLLDAVAYLHARQIVHRDLKPSNIMITHNGNNVKLIDFGLSDKDEYAVLKQPAGTVSYAAPEQLTEGLAVDGRADIYALGKIIALIFPKRYRGVVGRCMREQRDERYSSVEALKVAIKRADRRSVLLPRLLLTVCIIGVLLGGLWWQYNRMSHRVATFAPVDTLVMSSVDTVYIVEYDTVVVEVEKGFTAREQQIADEVSNEIRQEYSRINDMVERGDCRYCDIVLSYMATAVARVRARMHQVCMQDEVEPQAHKFMAIWNNVNEVEYNKLYARVRKLPYTPDALKEGELSQAEYDSLRLLLRQMKDEMMLLITQ